MSKRANFLGICGVLLVVFGQLTNLLVPEDLYRIGLLHTVLGLILLVIYFVRGGVGSLKASASDPSMRRIWDLVLYTIAVFGVVIVVNILATRRSYFRYDTTEAHVYTLAPETQSVLEHLPGKLEIRGFFLGGKVENGALRDLLGRIANGSDRVSLEIIDPEKQITLLDRFGITAADTLHFSLDVGGNIRTAKISRTLNEEEIVNAVKKLMRGDARTVYYLFGHGEREIEKSTDRSAYTFLREAVEGENLTLRKLILGSGAQVPKDGVALMIAAPTHALLEGEREAIVEYLKNGGRAILLNEPRTTPDIGEIAKSVHISVGENVVLDQQNRLYGAGGGVGVEPIINSFARHPITENFKQAIIFTTTSTATALAPEIEGAHVSDLARTGEHSWAESDLELLFNKAQSALDDRDIRGPVSVAAAFEGPKGEGASFHGSRVVVLGDADFVSNGSIAQLFNRDFFLNALNWVVGEEGGVTIRARTLRESKQGLTRSQFSEVFLLTAILLPELLLLGGLGIWWKRRN